MSYAGFILAFLLITFLIYQGKSMAYARRRSLYRMDLNALQDIYDREYRRAGELLERASSESREEHRGQGKTGA